MKYELAKRLKDSGFPVLYLPHHDRDGKLQDLNLPTLAELIAECGEEFSQLTYKRGSKQWLCASKEIIAVSATPEEAVANLWLALNASR